jgi:hypothetical protein
MPTGLEQAAGNTTGTHGDILHIYLSSIVIVICSPCYERPTPNLTRPRRNIRAVIIGALVR